MIILLLLSVIICLFITGITGILFIGLAAAVFVFICGLPGTLINGFVHGEVKYAQDREDLRQMEAEITGLELAEQHEILEDARTDRLAGAIGNVNPVINNDNRQVHIHNQAVTFPVREGNSNYAMKEK
jgi:hypothetical protein